MDRTRNAAYSYGYPGFESQSLRKEGNGKGCLLCFRERILFASLKRRSRNESQSLRKGYFYGSFEGGHYFFENSWDPVGNAYARMAAVCRTARTVV